MSTSDAATRRFKNVNVQHSTFNVQRRIEEISNKEKVEHRTEKLVYELYELTDEEIAIVENE